MCVIGKGVLLSAQPLEGTGMACVTLASLLALHTNRGCTVLTVPWQGQDSLLEATDRLCWVEGREP